MSEPWMKPLLCTGSVVRNLLNVEIGSWPPKPIDALKPFQTQDRRIAKHRIKDPSVTLASFSGADTKTEALALFGAPGIVVHVWSPHKVGDVLYVRETCAHFPGEKRNPWIYRATTSIYDDVDRDFKWTPAIHAPKESSRIHLEVMRVRVERACDITEEDAIAEGVGPYGKCAIHKNPQASFQLLWQSLYGPDSWEKWCWCYDFKRVK